MKKILITIFSILIFTVTTVIIILSTSGYETHRFNNFITEQINKNDNKLFFELKKIKFKLDIKNLSLYLKTTEPIIKYKKTIIPVEDLKVYLNLFSLINSQPKVSKINFLSKEININELKKIILKTKPSSLNSFITNKIDKGKGYIELEIYLENDQTVRDYIAKGAVKEMNINIDKNLKLSDTKFNFFADSSDILLKKINSKSKGMIIYDGSLQIKKEDFTYLKTDFKTKIQINKKNTNDYLKFYKNISFINKNITLDANLNHFLDISFDNTYKVIEYNYKNKGKVLNSSVELRSPINFEILKKKIKSVYFRSSEVKTEISAGKNIFEIAGDYSLDNIKFQKFKINNKKIRNISSIELDLDFQEEIEINLINYFKKKDILSRISTKFTMKKDSLNIDEFEFKEGNNLIFFEDLIITNNKLQKIKKFEVKTYLKNSIKNDFKLSLGKQIKISGKKYDAKNFNKLLNKNSKDNIFKEITKNIEIDLKNIDTPMSKKLSNFKLLGNIRKGKFVKISSKGEFDNDKFLDISMKSDKKSKKKYLEIYSDLPQPLLSEYSFFKGLSDGILTFSSIIDEKSSVSKLVIEDFKLVNAPAVVKLLSLADFGGLADLAEGEGLSFKKMEINIVNEKDFLKLNELYAVGPSISVLMEGYKDENGLTSLRGTLVPAKNLNKLLSKIPVIGNIIIPKEVGEGLFGVSFKMKGMPGKIKTTINPIKTLTPRFITKALEKNKQSK